jgi:hypothetical protein
MVPAVRRPEGEDLPRERPAGEKQHATAPTGAMPLMRQDVVCDRPVIAPEGAAARAPKSSRSAEAPQACVALLDLGEIAAEHLLVGRIVAVVHHVRKASIVRSS